MKTQTKAILVYGVLAVLALLDVARAHADTQLVLNQGQCAQVDGRNYCWFYRPSVWSHPELPAQPCDFRKDCPLTLLIPTTAQSGNLMTPAMEQQLNGYNSVAPGPMVNSNSAVLPTQPQARPAQAPAMFFCKRKDIHHDEFILVKVLIDEKKQDKTEIVVNDYGTDEEKCQKDEAQFRNPASAPQVRSVGGPVVIDTYDTPNGSYSTTQYEYKTIKFKDLLKKVGL